MWHFKNQNPVLIPENSLLEGFIKTKKSSRIERNFQGTLLSTKKVIIENSSNVIGNIVCSELHINGSFEGNIYCTEKLTVNARRK